MIIDGRSGSEKLGQNKMKKINIFPKKKKKLDQCFHPLKSNNIHSSTKSQTLSRFSFTVTINEIFCCFVLFSIFPARFSRCSVEVETVNQRRHPSVITRAASHASLTFIHDFEALRADSKVCGEPQGQYRSAAHYRRRQHESGQPEKQTNKKEKDMFQVK